MSFISVDPQSRVVLESHSNGLLSQFDTHFRIISDRYLAFFLERHSIEKTYIDSLRRLYRSATTVDASFDARSEPTNTRAAWDRVRDNLESEARTQQAFVDILDRDVIKPLQKLKVTIDVIRSRIKDDLEESAMRYADHAENTISKLQEAYLKKYHPLEYSHSIRVSQPREDVRNKRFGSKVSTLFRGQRERELVKPEEVTDHTCRGAVRKLNEFRSMRAENLGDGYGCLEGLIFTPTIKNALTKYMDGMITTHAKYDDLSKSTTAEVKNTLAGTDTSDLKSSFRQALSFSIPPLTLYRNYRPGAYSKLIFGVPLVELAIEDNVPKVIRMCIEEIENRGLDTKGIYPAGPTDASEVLELRRRFESEKSFSFSPADNIRSVAALFTRYLWDIPEPLLVLSLEEYRQYTQYRDDFWLLRSKLRELHPVHRASLRALLRHFSRVASHWEKNAMTIKALTGRFSYAILRGNLVIQGGVHVKTLVMEDLINNVHTLFDEHNVAESTSTHTYGSLFLSPEFPQRTEVPTLGSTKQGLVDGIPTSTQSPSASLPKDAAIDSRLTPSQTKLLSTLLGLPSSNTLTDGVETTSQEDVISAVKGAKAVEALASSTPAEVVSVPPTSVAEWQSQLPPQPEALTIPQSPPESVLSSTSDFPLSSATSLQTGMGRF